MQLIMEHAIFFCFPAPRFDCCCPYCCSWIIINTLWPFLVTGAIVVACPITLSYHDRVPHVGSITLHSTQLMSRNMSRLIERKNFEDRETWNAKLNLFHGTVCWLLLFVQSTKLRKKLFDFSVASELFCLMCSLKELKQMEQNSVNLKQHFNVGRDQNSF